MTDRTKEARTPFILEREVQRANAEYFDMDVCSQCDGRGYEARVRGAGPTTIRILCWNCYGAGVTERQLTNIEIPASIRKGARPEDFDYFNRYVKE